MVRRPGTRCTRGGAVDFRAFLVLAGVAAGYALTVFVFYPGYVTIDARYVYADALAWQFGDWQSPAMGVLWRADRPDRARIAQHVPAHRHALLAGLRVGRDHRGTAASAWLAFATLLLALIPPAFFFVGLVWRDILFGVAWLVASALAFAAADRNVLVRLPLQALSLALTAFGVLLRPNAILAAPFLAAYAVWPLRFDLKRMAIVFVPAAMLAYALIPLVYYGMLDAKRQNPLHSIMVFDLGGITHFTGNNQFPVAWSAEQTALLDQPVLRSGPLGQLLARAALPVRDAAIGAAGRLDFRHAAIGPGMVARGHRTSPRLSDPSRDLHVAVPGPLEFGPAGLGLA